MWGQEDDKQDETARGEKQSKREEEMEGNWLISLLFPRLSLQANLLQKGARADYEAGETTDGDRLLCL